MNVFLRHLLTASLVLLPVQAAEPPPAAPTESRLPVAFVAPMSHLDLTFMGSVDECLSRGGKVFTGALDLLEKQPDFRFFVEYVLFLEAFRSVHPELAAKIDDHIRAGRIELGAEWSGIYVTQEDEEDLIRNILYAKAYAKVRYNLDLETLQLTDIPGAAPQLPQVCAGLGIRNLVLTRCAMPDTLFWYESPAGARVLTWSSKSYNQASHYGIHLDVAAMRKRGLAERLAEAEKGGVPPLFYYGLDQWLPPPALAAGVSAWNSETHATRQQLSITTPTAYFRAIRAAQADGKLPVLRGELPSTWPYLEPAHAHVSRWDATATRALDAAERLSTLAWLRAGRPYPRAELEQVWKSLLLARDHNYGGQGAKLGQARKYAERRNVQHRAQVLASQAMASLAERVEAPRESVPVVVFNTLNWERSGPVSAHVSRYEAASGTQPDIFQPGCGMVLRSPNGEPVPFQITADRRDTLGEFDFSFIARDVPALGYSSYTLEPVALPEAMAREAAWTLEGPRIVDRTWFEVPSLELILENGALRLSIDRQSGQAKLTALRGKPGEVVSNLCLTGREELPEVCRRPPLGLSVDDPSREVVENFKPVGPESVRVLAKGPVLVSAAIRGEVLGTPAELRYSLLRDLPWVDVEVRLDWDIRRFGRIELAYQVPLTDAHADYGLPFGAGAFDANRLMPGSGPIGGDEGSRASWERTREISRWLDIGTPARGVAMATSHRWTRVDESDTGQAVRCCLVRGGRMRSPDPAAEGPEPRVGLVFNFRLQPHGGSWQAARIPRLGWEATQPLLSYTVNDTWSAKSLPKRQSLVGITTASGDGDALLTCLKQAEDGTGVVARWYESTGHSCRVQAALPPAGEHPNRTDLLEQVLTPGKSTGSDIATAAWEIVTIRARNPGAQR